MNTLAILLILAFLVQTFYCAVPNHQGCEFYLDKMNELYEQNFPRSNAVFRDPTSDGVEGFFQFLRKPGDLAIIMDRSEGFSAYFFYLMQRPFIEFILRHHAVISEDHTRLLLMTFAKDLTLLFDGISFDSDLDKCALFENEGPWSKALYNRDPDVSQGTYIDHTLNKAFDTLTNSQRQVPRAILVVTDGSWNSDRNQRIERVMTLIRNAGIQVYSMMSGVYGISQYGNVKDVATDKDHYAEESTWVEAALSLKPAIKWYTPGAPWSCSQDSCCHPVAGNVSGTNPGICRKYRCQNGGLCVEGVGVATCLCQLGFHGNECQLSVDDCLRDACPRETVCEDNHHRFTCTCPNKTEECLEVVKGLCGYVAAKNQDVPVLTDKNEKYRDTPENGTMPTWYTGPTTTIHQYHFISINAIIAVVCVCLVLFLLIIGVAACICSRRDQTTSDDYPQRSKQCLCCKKPTPEVPQANVSTVHPGPSVSMETFPGAVANPVLEVDDFPMKYSMKDGEDDASDIYQRPVSSSSGRGSSSQDSRSTVPSISQTLQSSQGRETEPPPYSSLYMGATRQKNRRDSQQPLLVPQSPDSFGSTSNPLTDLYPEFNPVDINPDQENDPDLLVDNDLDPVFNDPYIQNNNNVSQDCQALPTNGDYDINNFMDLPVNSDINYELTTAEGD